MPQRRYIVSILFDFDIFEPFAFSLPWIFSALRCTSRASRGSRLKQSLTFRSVPCCLNYYNAFVALELASALTRERKPARRHSKNKLLPSVPLHRSPHLPVKEFSLKQQQPTYVPTFTSSTRRRCGEFRSHCIVGNVVYICYINQSQHQPLKTELNKFDNCDYCSVQLGNF